MKAVVFNTYGPPEVLKLIDIAKPTPRDNEVLVEVYAVSLNDWDYGALLGDSLINRIIFGLFKPRIVILGSDIAGRVVAVGKRVTQFRPGDEVFGDLSGQWGGFAEFVCAKEKALALKSSKMSFEQAAAIPQAGMLALQGLRAMGQTHPGQKLLINGAGGGVGTFAIQLAKLDGLNVTAVDSAEKHDLMLSLGADSVIDYTREDFTVTGQRYDLILDVKTSRSIFKYARALSENGIYVTVGGSIARLVQTMLIAPWIARTQHKRMQILSLKLNHGLAEMNQLFEAGKVKPVIEGPFRLDDIPQLFRVFGEGRHKGKMVVSLK